MSGKGGQERNEHEEKNNRDDPQLAEGLQPSKVRHAQSIIEGGNE